MIRISGVPLEQVKEYQNVLSENGLRFLGGREDGKKFSLLYESGGSDFAIFWENETVKIIAEKNSVCFVPALYLSAMAPRNPLK